MTVSKLQKDTSQKFTFFSGSDYYYDLISKIEKTKKGDRVVLATMAFNPSDKPIQQLLDAVYAAAQRGVITRMLVDAFPFIVREGIIPGPLLFTRSLPRKLTKTFAMRLESLQKLREHGGVYHLINHPRRPLLLPFARRSHIKFAVVNDEIYIGGCNLAGAGNIDLMVRFSDARTADWLRSLEEKIAKNGRVSSALNGKDLTQTINKETSLLVDAGIPNQSLIFDKALALIDSAQKYIYITCQYFPNDVTIRRLAAASARGVKVTIIYNHQNKHSFPFNLLHHGVVWSEKQKYSQHFFAHQLPKRRNFIHAKLLATDKGTIVGSHNYVRAGVAFGTAEIALFSTSKQFNADAVQHIAMI